MTLQLAVMCVELEMQTGVSEHWQQVIAVIWTGLNMGYLLSRPLYMSPVWKEYYKSNTRREKTMNTFKELTSVSLQVKSDLGALSAFHIYSHRLLTEA